MTHAITDTTVAGIAGKVTQGAAAVTVYGGLTANEWAAFGGLLIAIIGALIQWAYKHRADKREAEHHAERMAEMKRRGML